MVRHKQTRTRKILVLGDDTRSFLAVVRSLGRDGMEVHVAWYGDTPEAQIALRSRYIARSHDLPGPTEPVGEWMPPLVDLLRREGFDLVIPCNDRCLIPLHEHRGELEPICRCYWLDDHVYRIAFDKIAMSSLARSLGIHVPQEVVVKRCDDLDSLPASLKLPVVVKPYCSFSADDLTSRHHVRTCRTWDECNEAVRSSLAVGPVAVQQHFAGVGAGVELLLDHGVPKIVFQHVRLHEPPRGGGSSYRLGVAPSRDLVDAATRLLASLQYTGVAMVEFRLNQETGEWVFIEVNARFWGSLPLAVASGAAFPRALVELCLDGGVSSLRSPRAGLRCRNWTYDLNWNLGQLARRRSSAPTAARWVAGEVWQSIAALATIRERSDTFAVDDPAPALAEMRQIATRVIGATAGAVRRRFWRAAPGRILLARRARAALRSGRTICFVCKGNVCRSPFAAEVARHITDRTVISAGYRDPFGRPSPEEAISEAAALGFDLSRHRSDRLTHEHVAQADMIIVFDFDNYNRVVSEFRVYRSKVHFLGAIDRNGPLTIEDPWAQGAEVFARIFERIRANVEAMFIRERDTHVAKRTFGGPRSTCSRASAHSTDGNGCLPARRGASAVTVAPDGGSGDEA